ncbi:hypothetical protein E2C01_095098 [Portunus trituberculatus]|uniref:Uncharacterized protein n=1 Tax=Portunus trituberculatus TaxID=210409 RepID=A0A5B7JS93_PORTR|nr:hypothetical protein [Portunus trituberculatus]
MRRKIGLITVLSHAIYDPHPHYTGRGDPTRAEPSRNRENRAERSRSDPHGDFGANIQIGK